MYELNVTTSFNAAHNLRNYRGRCERIHGHNWKVEVTIRGKKLDKTGILLDFKKIKDAINDVIVKIDHRHLNRIAPFTRINPSSENIAKYIYEQLKRHKLFYNKYNLHIYKISVWETDTAGATYMKD